MRKRTCFLPQAGVLLMLVLTVCACTSVPKGCTIEGTVKDKSYEGKQVYLRHALTPETYDSTIVKNGTFRFTLGETSPEVSLLVLKASSDDLFPVTLPVVTEKGVVKVVLGELVLTSGTDLNDRLQDFLLAVDRFGDEMAGKGESHGKIKKDLLRFAGILHSPEQGQRSGSLYLPQLRLASVPRTESTYRRAGG